MRALQSGAPETTARQQSSCRQPACGASNMPVTKRRNKDGSTSWMGHVNVRPFRRTAKAFPDKKSAQAWADTLEETLREQRTRGAVRTDVGSLTFAQIVVEYLKETEIAAKKYLNDLHRHLTWWTNHFGAVRALEFSVLVIRDARERLRKQHEPGTCNRYLSAARSCLNWARGSGLVPVERARPPPCMFREPKHRERFLTDAELGRLLVTARQHSTLVLAAVTVAVGT